MDSLLNRHISRSLRLVLGVLGACAEGEGTPPDSGPRVTVEVAALGLDEVGDVVWDLEVVNGKTPVPDVVWRQRITASRYGDGRGSATYVGPCDASTGVAQNTVRLWVVGLYDAPVKSPGAFASGGAAGVVGSSLPFQSPTLTQPLTQTVPCAPNADSPVVFDMTLMRPAEQGFFDIAVNFNDIFCSAKFDCCVEDALGACGPDLELLHDGTGERATTFVLGFACTAGPGTDVETELYLDAVELDCTPPHVANGFVADLVIDPSGPTGNQCVAGQLGTCGAITVTAAPPIDPDDYLFQVGLYRGLEALTTGGPEARPANKIYWNLALGGVRKGLGEGTVGIEDCRLRTRGTADDALGTPLMDAGVIAPGQVYPYIQWQVDLGSCGAEPLSFGDPSAMVVTAYTSTSAENGTGFGYGFGPNRPAGPVAAVSGLCGGAAGQSSPSAPVVGLCARGTASLVTGEGPYAWSCVGQDGGVTASCSANRSCAGSSGSWTVGESSCEGELPLTAHGATATVSDATLPTSGSRDYTCNQGTWVGVGAGTCVTAIDGLCGSADGGSTLEAPGSGLCASGTPSSVTGDGPFEWTCAGSDGGETASCSGNRSCAGSSESWTVGESSCEGVLPLTAHGATATVSDETLPTTGSRDYSCDQGTWVGDGPGTCVTAVDGACGSAQGGSTLTAPGADLCATGIPSEVAGSGPYTWSCSGIHGGSSASCSADRSCNGTSQSWTVSSSTCSASVAMVAHGFSAVASDATLPTTGSRTYTCAQGTWTGSGTGTCVTAVNGACGSVHGTSVTTAPANNLCSAGTASSVFGSGPYTWTCNGGNGGTNASCSANRSCVTAYLDWTAGGNTCGGWASSAAHNQTSTAFDNSPPTTGFCWVTCSQGSWIRAGWDCSR